MRIYERIHFIFIYLSLCCVSIFLLAFNPSLYRYNFKLCKVQEDLSVSNEDLDIISNFLASFLQSKQTNASIVLKNEDGGYEFFSKTSALHMQDVRMIFSLLRYFFYLCLFFSSFTFLWMAKRHVLIFYSKHATYFFKRSLIVTISAGLLIVLFFDSAFVMFHRIFFRNDLWLIEPSDTLIRLMPQEFFIRYALYLFAACCLAQLFIILLCEERRPL